LSNWISPRDFARLVTVGIENPNIGFEIVYGVSDNKRSWYDNSNAHRLGYQAQDDAERYAEEVLAKEKPGDPRAEMYQGGNFVFAEIGGDPSRAGTATEVSQTEEAIEQESAGQAEEAGQAEKEEMTLRRSRLVAPPGMCDTHMHFYDTSVASAPGGPALPGNYSVPMYRELQKRLGMSRVVVVQPNAYQDDNRVTLSAMKELGADARGVAVVRTSVADEELQRLTQGVSADSEFSICRAAP
jgi:hypothetical protein